MAELPPEMVRLIEAARRAHDPSDADCERVRHGLAAAIGAQASLSPPSGAEGAAGTSGSGTLGALFGTASGKLLVVAALVGGAGGIWAWRSSSESRRAPPPPALVTRAQHAMPAQPASTSVREEPRSERAEPIAVTQLGERAEPIAVTQLGEPAAPDGAAQAPRRAAVRASAVRPARSSVPPARPPRSALAQAVPQPAARAQETPSEPAPAGQQAAEPVRTSEATSAARAVAEVALQRVPVAQEVPREIVKAESEVALIRAALASLNASDPQRALELLDTHATRFPTGAMGRERAGLRVLALCASGRVQEGRREQAAFLDAATDSPLHNRVGRACD